MIDIITYHNNTHHSSVKPHTMTETDRNLDPELGQAQKCGRVKLDKWTPSWYLYLNQPNKNKHYNSLIFDPHKTFSIMVQICLIIWKYKDCKMLYQFCDDLLKVLYMLSISSLFTLWPSTIPQQYRFSHNLSVLSNNQIKTVKWI